MSVVTSLGFTSGSWEELSDAAGREYTWIDFTSTTYQTILLRIVSVSGWYQEGYFFVEAISREGNRMTLTGTATRPNEPAFYK